MSTINSDEHDAKHGVRSEQEQPLAPEHRDKPGASSYQHGNQEKQRGDVKRAGASARTSEHDRASASHPSSQFYQIGSKMNHMEQNVTNGIVALLKKAVLF